MAGTTRRSSHTGRSHWTRRLPCCTYAQEVFEGLKAYRHEDGTIWTFRADRNAERMIRSARRLALPDPAG